MPGVGSAVWLVLSGAIASCQSRMRTALHCSPCLHAHVRISADKHTHNTLMLQSAYAMSDAHAHVAAGSD